jgi:hypothetical protein
MSCLVKAFVSVLLLQLIKKKKASALAVSIIDFNIVVFLVTIFRNEVNKFSIYFNHFRVAMYVWFSLYAFRVFRWLSMKWGRFGIVSSAGSRIGLVGRAVPAKYF